MSIVEAFTMDLGEDELARRLDPSTLPSEAVGLVTYLIRYRWQPITRTGGWTDLLEVWKEGFSLNPKAFGDWQSLDLLRHTRHSIVHRLGELTPTYRAKAVARLRALGLDPDVASGLIPLTHLDVTGNIELCRRFVRWLDERVNDSLVTHQ